MGYSDEYFYSMFKKCYEAAMNAKAAGNLALAGEGETSFFRLVWF